MPDSSLPGADTSFALLSRAAPPNMPANRPRWLCTYGLL